MLKNVFLVGLGGFIGSAARYLCYLLPFKTQPYWTTLSINLLGSFIMGMLVAWTSRNTGMSDTLRLFLTVGICGGFTTFSTLSAELFHFVEQQKWTSFALYLSLSMIGGIIAFLAGQKCI